MEKRLFYALLLTFLFMIGYSYLVSKVSPPQPQLQKQEQEQKEFLERKLPEEELILKEPQALPLAEELPQASIGEFDVTYSPRGGYIKELLIKKYGDQLHFQNIGFIPEEKDKEFTPRIYQNRLVFVSPQGERKEFIFEGYLLTIKSRSASPLLLFSNPRAEGGLEGRYQEFFYSQNGIIQRKSFNKVKDSQYKNIEFVGARDRYYCISLLKGSYTIKWAKSKKEVYLYLNTPFKEVSLYIGPQDKKELSSYDLQEIIYYGFFHGIALGILKLLHFFYSLTKNWGISIILLSAILQIVLFPLTSKSSKGMKEMQEFQRIHKPELEKIKEKYKNNPHKIHQATMEMYKKYGFNPLKGCASGCLPMFFQFPIIFAFWGVAARALEFKGAKFLWIKDLSLPDRAFHLPFALPFLGHWINLLPPLTAVFMYLQMKFASPKVDPEQAQQQKMMALIFPVMIGAFTYRFPSALLLYWFTNSILTFFSQRKIMKAKSG